jgi:DNA repair protein RadC
MTTTSADPRLILSVALKTAATGLILMHNHPSGNLCPSKADITLTQRLKESCEMLELTLLDHLIVVPGGNYHSMVENGNM